MDKAIKDFQRLMTEHRRLLDGHRVMMKNFPKWKDEFENRMGLDMYTATKDSKLLPKSFVNDEHAWINALQTRLESLHFNMKYLHEQRQLLEKTHKDLEKLFAIFNRNRKFMHLIDLPAFDPQQYKVPDVPQIVPMPSTEESLNNFDIPANLTLTDQVINFATSALADFEKAKQDIERFTLQMSDARKSICAANAERDNAMRFGNLAKYRKAERDLQDAKARVAKVAEQSRRTVEKIINDKIENCEWELDRLSSLVEEYEEMRFQ